MLHQRGPLDQEHLVESLKKYLPYDGSQILSFDVEYMDDDLGKLIIANFIWVNSQWVYVDSTPR